MDFSHKIKYDSTMKRIDTTDPRSHSNVLTLAAPASAVDEHHAGSCLALAHPVRTKQPERELFIADLFVDMLLTKLQHRVDDRLRLDPVLRRFA